MTSKEFVLENTESAIFNRGTIHLKYKDMRRTFRIFDNSEIRYGRVGDYYSQVVNIIPYRWTEESEQKVWSLAARHVKGHLYFLEHLEEFPYMSLNN